MNFKVDKFVVLRIYEGICNLTKDIESIRVLGTSLLYYAFERNDNEFKNEVNNLIKKGLSGLNYHLEKGFKIIIDK